MQIPSVEAELLRTDMTHYTWSSLLFFEKFEVYVLRNCIVRNIYT